MYESCDYVHSEQPLHRYESVPSDFRFLMDVESPVFTGNLPTDTLLIMANSDCEGVINIAVPATEDCGDVEVTVSGSFNTFGQHVVPEVGRQREQVEQPALLAGGRRALVGQSNAGFLGQQP